MLLFQFSSFQSLSRVWLFVTPWIVARQGLPVHHQLPEFTQTHVHRVGDAIQPSHPLLLLPPIPPSIRVFSNESTLRMRWPKYWSISQSGFQRVFPEHWCQEMLSAFDVEALMIHEAWETGLLNNVLGHGGNCLLVFELWAPSLFLRSTLEDVSPLRKILSIYIIYG